MRITQCHIDAFGHFRDRTFDGLDQPVVTIIGPNEAGKSTFFNFLRTMLYGIHPAEPGEHLYAPRDDRTLSGRLGFRLDDGHEAEVERSLLAPPAGHLLNGEREELGNEPLPMLLEIPKEVFQAVYSLTLADMTAIGEQAWDEVQEELLGGLSIDYVRPAYEVVGALEAEAGARWRPGGAGGKGNTLEQRRKELRAELKAAQEGDAVLRQLVAEVAEHALRIERLEEERVQLRTERRRAERLSPVRKLLVKIASLRKEAGDLAPFANIPEDPQAAVAELIARQQELDERLAEEERALSHAQAAVDAITDQDRHLLEHAAAVREWTKKKDEHELLMGELSALKEDLSQIKEHLQGYARRLLTVPWSNEVADALRALPEADLRQRIRAHEASVRRLRQARARAEATAAQRFALWRYLLPWIGATLIGAGLFGAGFVYAMISLQVAGAAVLAVGLMQAFNVWSQNQQGHQRKQPDLEDFEAAVEGRAASVASLLEGLPLPPERRALPDGELMQELQEWLTALHAYDAQVDHLRELAKMAEANNQEVLGLIDACDLPPAPSLTQMVDTLQTGLARAESRWEGAEAALTDLNMRKETVAALQAARRDTEADRRYMERQLAALGDGDTAVGITRLIQRRKAADLSAHHEETLRKEYPDWQDLQEEIEGIEDEEWAYTDEEVVRIVARLENVEQALREEDTARATKTQELERVRQLRPPAEVESELVYLRQRLKTLKQERDRRLLLANLITRADQTFRMKHQPEVLERAGVYLRRFTEERYTGLALEKGRSLLVYEGEDALPKPVLDSMSQGTRDQIYLAIRFAIIDHLDDGQERLPLFLDEVFVNWDRYRRESGYRILQDMAQQRQLFFFTCHAWMAEELNEFLGAHPVELGQVA